MCVVSVCGLAGVCGLGVAFDPPLFNRLLLAALALTTFCRLVDLDIASPLVRVQHSRLYRGPYSYACTNITLSQKVYTIGTLHVQCVPGTNATDVLWQ